MISQMHTSRRMGTERRVVEFEFSPSQIKELYYKAQSRLEPLRDVAEQILLTSIGAGVLLGRGINRALKTAHQAGQEAAQRPGPITKAFLRLVRTPQTYSTTEIRVCPPKLPLDRYDELTASEITEALAGLSREQLLIIREYELGHKNRVTVLRAIEHLLEGKSAPQEP